jgi:uncharacterized membrane protein YtjA (UPF0391 family)
MLALVASTPLLLGGGGLLYWAVVFAILALLAALVGFRGIAGISMGVARLFVFVFLVLAIATLLF